MKNKINISNHCPKVNYCTFIKVNVSSCTHIDCSDADPFAYHQYYEHRYCKKCMFEELTKHNYKNETE